MSLEYCTEHHNCLRQSSFQPIVEESEESEPKQRILDVTTSPSRLIDVSPLDLKDESIDDSVVKLIDVSDSCPRYITLSHCWGGTLTPEHCTMTDNLAARKLGIAFDSLPCTFQDAITITRRLGIRYLWIDALCILQDSKVDWAEESVKMATVYDNSFLTIAASASANKSGGCFRKNIKGLRNLAFDSLFHSSKVRGVTYDITGPDDVDDSQSISVHITDTLDS